MHIDKVLGKPVWDEATKKEIASVNEHGIFRVLDEGESIPPGHVQMPHHFVFDIKCDGCQKARLVEGGHRTPDVPKEERHSGVVSVDTV